MNSNLTNLFFTFSSANVLTEEQYEEHMLVFKSYVKKTLKHDRMTYHYEKAGRLHIHGIIFDVGVTDSEVLCAKYSKYMHKRIGRKGLKSCIAARVEVCNDNQAVYEYIIKDKFEK